MDRVVVSFVLALSFACFSSGSCTLMTNQGTVSSSKTAYWIVHPCENEEQTEKDFVCQIT